MQTYRVTVVASYQADADMSEMLGGLARNDVESSGVITFSGDEGGRPLQTLTATYEDVEGRTEELARQFAIAIFKLESSRWPMPAPQAMLATWPTDPLVTGWATRGGAMA